MEDINKDLLVEGKTTSYTKTIRKIPLNNITFTPNVRHAHLWDKKSYDPFDVRNYDEDAINQMLTTLIDNFLEGKPVFDNEPWVFLNEQTGAYEIQVGNTRTITLCHAHTFRNHLLELYSPEDVEAFLMYVERACTSAVVEFVLIDRELTNAEKRRENTVRTQQHWLATAVGYATDIECGESYKSIAKKEGISMAQVRKLVSVANKLSSPAKTACFKGLILQGPAVKMAEFKRIEQKLITDYIKEHPHVCPIRSIKDLTAVLTASFKVLPEDFPMESFKDTKLKVHPPVQKESWYVDMSEGMFTKHLTKDWDAAMERFELWKEVERENILEIHPDAKEVDDVPKNATLSDERECMHGRPIIVNGYKLMFACTSKECEVHKLEPVTTEDKVEKAKERVAKQTWKETFEKILTAFAIDRQPFNSSDDSRAILRAIALDEMIARMPLDAKKAVVGYLEGYIKDALGKEVTIPIDFTFFSAIEAEEMDDLHQSLYIVLRENRLLEMHLGYCMLINSPHKRKWIKEFMKANSYHMKDFFDADEYKEKEQKAISNATKQSKQHQALNFMRYNVCPALSEFHEEESRATCKGYVKLFGKHIALSGHLQCTDSDELDFEAMNLPLSKDNIQLAKAVLRAMGYKGIGKLDDDIDVLNATINLHLKEWLPVIRQHEDEQYAAAVDAWERNHTQYERILHTALEIAEVWTDDVINPKVDFERVVIERLNYIADWINNTYRDELKSPVAIQKGEFPKMIQKQAEKGEFFKEDWLAMVERRFGYEVLMHALTQDKPKVPGATFPKSPTTFSLEEEE